MPDLERLLHHSDKEIIFASSAAITGLTQRKNPNCSYDIEHHKVVSKMV